MSTKHFQSNPSCTERTSVTVFEIAFNLRLFLLHFHSDDPAHSHRHREEQFDEASEIRKSTFQSIRIAIILLEPDRERRITPPVNINDDSTSQLIRELFEPLRILTVNRERESVARSANTASVVEYVARCEEELTEIQGE